MPIDSATPRPGAEPGLWDRFTALVDADGSNAQSACRRLADPRAPIRDLADAMHCLCLLHGSQSGSIGVALARSEHPVAREWFAVAARGFAVEREWLARLISAAGPLPSTPGQTESENAIATQRHALVMLAQSERIGCALGAAAALVMDWHRLRPLLDRIGIRLYLELTPSHLPSVAASRALLNATPITPVIERGFLFGAQQLLAQQRGLWGLIDARASARTAL